jgi:uncharacterized damage-inducible protein DinB
MEATLDAVTTEELIQRIERSTQQLIQEIQQMPPNVLYQAPEAGEWPVMSTLAHVSELMPYWAHQAEAIAQSPGVRFGRQHDDPRRIGAVADHGQDSLDSMVPRLRAGLDECVKTLRALPAEAWTRAGQHPSRGSMTAELVISTFVADHIEEHTAQIKATLRVLAAAPH